MECVWCLLPRGHLQDQNKNRLQLSGCGQRLITGDDTTSPKRHAEASTLDANTPGHLSEEDYTAGSQPDLMQCVTVTDLAEGCLLIHHSSLRPCLSTREA